MPLTPLLARFSAAVQANDGRALAALFTEDGVYDDGFFGPHRGRPAIAAMLQRFHDGGRDYWWEFIDPVLSESVGYARWRFSYASRNPHVLDQPVLFEGMSCFTLRGGAIAYYREIFDRGLALVQQDYPAEQLKRILGNAAAMQNAKPENHAHLARFAPSALNDGA